MESAEELDKTFKQKYLPQLLERVNQQLQAAATEQAVEVNALATTLLCFIATSHWLVAMQVGDGLIVVRRPGQERYELLFQPDKGEYINETTFVTSANAQEDLQVRVMAEPVEFLCAATDGVEKVSVNYVDWQPHPPFFRPLDQYLQQTPEPLPADLQEFLEREDLQQRTTDDKTLLIAHWPDSHRGDLD